MADEKKDKQEKQEKQDKESKNPFKKINDGFGKFGNLFKKKEDDPVFLGHKENFKKQRAIAMQYNVVFQKYEDCLKDMVECQEKLHNIVEQTYETDWAASYELKEYMRGASLEWNNYRTVFSKLLEDQKSYLARFDELKKKISHRRKKRDEYEQAKKDLEAKQQAKKPDSAKIALADIDFKARKSEFEKVDAELLVELPEFYASRTTFYQTNISTLAKSDKHLYIELVDYLKRAVTKFEGAEDTRPNTNHRAARQPSDVNNPFADSAPSSTPVSIYPQIPKNDSARNSPTPRHRLTIPPSASSTTVTTENRTKSAAPTPAQASPAVASTTVTATPTAPAKPPRITKLDVAEESAVQDSPGNPFLADDSETESSEQVEIEKAAKKSRSSSNSTNESKREPVDAIPLPERSPKLPRTTPEPSQPSSDVAKEVVIKKVRATHKYVAIEEDELAFEKGDIIEVLPWLSEEDAEDGWLRGRRELDGKYGVFPENHTKPIV